MNTAMYWRNFSVGLYNSGRIKESVEPLKKVISVAKLAEELGFEHFVHADQRFSGEKDVFVTLAADALNTTTIKLGPCVSDPFSRIPAMLAAAVASLRAGRIKGRKFAVEMVR